MSITSGLAGSTKTVLPDGNGFLVGDPWEYTNWWQSNGQDNSGIEGYLYMYHTGSDKGKWGYRRANQNFPADATVGFILEKNSGSVGSIEAVLSEPASEGMYQNMTLELFNVETEKTTTITTSKNLKYIFRNVSSGSYRLQLKNKYGAVLGTKDNVIVEDETITVTFDALTEVYAATLKVKGKEGTTHASKPEVKWFDGGNTYLALGGSIGGLTAGSKLGYRLTFDKEWSSLYVLPEIRYHTMVEGDNTIVLELQGISVVPIKSGATVTASQLLNGKYSKVTTTQTDKNGKFSLSTYNDSTSVLVSYPDYITATIFKSDFNDGSDLGAITLQPVTGTVISLNFTYTPSVAHGDTATTENGYPDCQNMDYSLKNVTKGELITDFVVQYPQIVVVGLENVGDEIEITVSSRLRQFNLVCDVVTVDEALRVSAQLDVVQHGAVRAVVQSAENSWNIDILYDANGHWVNRYTYENGTFTTDDLPDGSYTQVSIMSSNFLNSIMNLSEFAAVGLAENIHYTLSAVSVQSGVITEVIIPSILLLDESQFYYTSGYTSFTVNKGSIVAGNYLTLRAEFDFKDEYKSEVRNMKLLVDIPESCSFV